MNIRNLLFLLSISLLWTVEAMQLRDEATCEAITRWVEIIKHSQAFPEENINLVNKQTLLSNGIESLAYKAFLLSGDTIRAIKTLSGQDAGCIVYELRIVCRLHGIHTTLVPGVGDALFVKFQELEKTNPPLPVGEVFNSLSLSLHSK